MDNLKQWRESEDLTQQQMADRLGESRATYATWESGRSRIPKAIAGKLREMGYTGPWPKEEAKESQGDYVTREDFAEWRGYHKAGMERVLDHLKDLDQRIAEIDARLRKLES